MTITVNAKIHDEGLAIIVDNKTYNINFPKEIWAFLPEESKEFLKENLAFGTTHFLPVMLDQEITYETKRPYLEQFFFMNQLYDMIETEYNDGVNQLTYLKKLYNSIPKFKEGDSKIPPIKSLQKKECAILPFTFGKESLVVFGLCLELGIEPILVYCQEPAHPHEEKIKREMLKKIEKEFKVKTHFIENDTGLFRYGKAFNIKPTEIGWGSQTSLLTLLMIPFVNYYNANYVLYGSEGLNNEILDNKGWKQFRSYDQTTIWTQHQNNIIELLFNKTCRVNTVLEPLEEINVQFMLHNRYKEIAKYQFSCHAKHPMLGDSVWCHRCYKCARMFLFSTACGFDTRKIGFSFDPTTKHMEIFDDYFKDKERTGQWSEEDFPLYVLQKSGFVSPLVTKFDKEILHMLPPFSFYMDYLTTLKTSLLLPVRYKEKIMEIFKIEMEEFKQIISKKTS